MASWLGSVYTATPSLRVVRLGNSSSRFAENGSVIERMFAVMLMVVQEWRRDHDRRV